MKTYFDDHGNPHSIPETVHKIRTAPKNYKESLRVPHKWNELDVSSENLEPSKTQQHFKEELDVNNIMKKYDDRINAVPFSNGGMYADFSEIQDFQGMLSTVQHAQDAFASLPAQTRKRFGNDPSLLLEFLQDSNNYDEGVKLGLLQPKQIQNNDDKQTQINNDDKNKNKKAASDPKIKKLDQPSADE